jgi:hypothetical protein
MKLIRGMALVLVLIGSGWAAAQEAWPKPGPEHEALKALTGEWDALVKCTGPDGKVEESTGTYSAKLDVGGYFLITEFKGKMLGMDFHGRGINGYDPFQKKYTGVWVDSMSPGLYKVEGSFDKEGRVLTEKMEGPGPDGTPMKFRLTSEIKGKDTFVQKLYMADPDGKEMMGIETTYTRKK